MDETKAGKALHAPILSHVQELYSFTKYRKSPLERLSASSPIQALLSAVAFLWRGLVAIVFDVLLSPSSFLLDPVQSLSILLFYPVFGAAILAISVGFALARVGGYGDSLIDYVSDRWAQGYSIVNWPAPELFDELASSVKQAQVYLDGTKATTDRQDWPLDEDAIYRERAVVRTFSLPLARTFLGFNALVYERKDALVIQAKEVATTAHEAFGEHSDAFIKELESAAQMLVLSEGTIHTQAEKWGVEFEGVSDLNSVAGSFAGLFYSPLGSQQPFIVLTFKGTGPTAFAEWLTDCTLDRTSATSVLGGGGAHTGFIEALFRSPRRDYEGNGYDTVVRALQQVAKVLRGNKDAKVQLWVTGHSLGGGYAELAFMRFLTSPDDLGPNIELRDCYTFGAPRPGDGQLAGLFEKLSLTPLDRPNALWRVKNRLDLVTRVPLGLADDEDVRDALSPLSVHNYAHLGPAVRLHRPDEATGQGRFSIEFLGRLRGSAHVRIVEAGDVDVPWQAAGGGGRSLDDVEPDAAPSSTGKPGAQASPSSSTSSSPSSGGGVLSSLRGMLKSALKTTDSALYRFFAERGTNPVKWGVTLFAALVPCVWNHFPASYLDSLGLPPSSTNAADGATPQSRKTATTAVLDKLSRAGAVMAVMPGPPGPGQGAARTATMGEEEAGDDEKEVEDEGSTSFEGARGQGYRLGSEERVSRGEWR